MARRVRSTKEAIESGTEEVLPDNGTFFINNYTNREFKLPNGGTYKFKLTRELVKDPETIATLKALAANPENRIFVDGDYSPEIEPEPETSEPEPTFPPAEEPAVTQ